MNTEKICGMYSRNIFYNELEKISAHTKAFHIWAIGKDLTLKGINKEGVLLFLKENGFYKKQELNGTITYIQIDNGIVRYVSKGDIGNFIYDFVKGINVSLKIFKHKGDTETKTIEPAEFLNIFHNNAHYIANDTALAYLEASHTPILRDTKQTSYVIFRNTILAISKEDIEEKSFSDFPNSLIPQSEIIEWDFCLNEQWANSSFACFIKNITNNDKDRKNAIRSAIGYLLSSYNDPAISKAVLLYDEELTHNDKPMGGTGKGILAKSLSFIRKGYVKKDGKGLKLDSQFLFQMIKENTRILFIDETDKTFDIDRFNSVLTDGMEVEKKFKEPISITKEDMPKFIIASNTVLPFEGTTRERRQFVIELSSYYSDKQRNGNNEPIIAEHGHRFFSDEWSNEEWNGFYSFMIKCIQFYLKNGLVKSPALNYKKNITIQKIGFEFFRVFEKTEFKDGEAYSTEDIHNKLIEDGIIEENTSLRGTTNKLLAYLDCKGISYNSPKKKIIKIIGRI